MAEPVVLLELDSTKKTIAAVKRDLRTAMVGQFLAFLRRQETMLTDHVADWRGYTASQRR